MTIETQVGTRQLGVTVPKVFPMPRRCTGMSGIYGAIDDNESIATIRTVLDAGVILLDTGDFYGPGHNEMLIGRALNDRRNQALGVCREPRIVPVITRGRGSSFPNRWQRFA